MQVQKKTALPFSMHISCAQEEEKFPYSKAGRVYDLHKEREREKMGVKGLAVVYEIAFDKHCSDPKRSGVIATTGFPF